MDREIEAVQRMQDYIKEHLTEDITLKELSEVALYSPWYSYRIFVKHTNMTVSKYIRSLRLSQAAVKLRDEGLSVTKVSMDLGFGCVDGFQRAFKDEFDINPKSYSINPIPIPLFIPYGVKYRERKEKKEIMESKNVFISLVEKTERKILCKRGLKADEYFSYCEEVGCDIWGILKSIDKEPLCLYLTKQYIKEGTSSYIQGAEVPVNYSGVISQGFELMTLPKTTYLMFQGEPFKEEDFEEAITSLKRAIEKYNPSTLGYDFDDNEPRIQLEPIGERGYIELVPVRRK